MEKKFPSKVRFANKELQEKFKEVEQNKEKKRLYKKLIRALKNIEENAFCGIQVPKRLIPKKYTKKYLIHNLWKYNLSESWRLLYSVESNRIVIIAIIVDWLPHKKYEKAFNY